MLLLDNFEQLLAAGPLLAEVIAECAGVRILATSRERLHLRPEQYVRVQPLSLEAAVELFVQRAATVDAGFALSATNRHTIEAICTRLDCLPLGLELCAAQMELFSAAQLLVQINDRPLELLQEGANDLQPHQRTLRAAIQTGYDLLDSEQRALLRSLSIFSGGCDLEAVREVGAWAIDAPLRSLSSMLRALLAKSLVNVEALAGGEKRFALLETVREFALEQVRAEGAIQALHARHFATYLNLARVADSHLRQPEAAFWFAQLDVEHDNIRAALQWALDSGQYTDAAWLVLAIQFYWHQRGHLEEAADWIEQLLPYCPEMETDMHISIKITYVAKAHALTRPVAMSRITEDLIALMDSCSDTLISSAAWYWIAATLPDFLQATVALERSVTLARAGSSTPETRRQFCLLSEGDFMLPQHLWGYASRLIDQGETAQATALTAESLALFRMCGDTRGVGECLGNLGRLAFLRGENGEARTLFLSVIDVGAKLGDREMLCTWQPRLGLATLYAGDTSEARRLLLESLSFCREVQNSHLLSRACCYLAEFALWQQELEQAGEWLAQSLGHHAEPHHFTVLQIRRLHVAARLAAARGSNTRAATLFGLVQAIRNRIGVELRGPMRSLEEAAMESMRARLDTSTFAAAFAAGQQLTLEEAFATILAPA